MFERKIKIMAVTALALPLAVFAAPAASAATMPAAPATSHQATPIGGGGSLHICFPLGSVVWCI